MRACFKCTKENHQFHRKINFSNSFIYLRQIGCKLKKMNSFKILFGKNLKQQTLIFIGFYEIKFRV